MISDKALDLILSFEGFDTGSWPGGASGVTWGYGWDAGYHTLEQFRADWQAWLTRADFTRLRTVIGLTGEAARKVAPFVTPVLIDQYQAREVFARAQMPRAEAATRTVFQGAESLPADAYGALVSLVFNRGTRLKDSHPAIEERREMRQVAEAVKHGDLRRIAVALRSMSRLWTGQLPAPYNVKMTGLVRRREAEAAMVEGCIA